MNSAQSLETWPEGLVGRLEDGEHWPAIEMPDGIGGPMAPHLPRVTSATETPYAALVGQPCARAEGAFAPVPAAPIWSTSTQSATDSRRAAPPAGASSHSAGMSGP